MTRPLVVLGATGSIGRQTLEVARRLDVPVKGIGARRGSEGLEELAVQHPEAVVGVSSPTLEEGRRLTAEFGERMRFGPEALTELAELPGTTVMNAVVGAAGLPLTVAALRAGNRLALANKESLVAAGPVVLAAAAEGGGELIPVDSEHSALLQCLLGEERSAMRRLWLTASGGPFRKRGRRDLENVTPAEALRHPTWRMGQRITVDSATLLNKGLEAIEAHFLFNLPYDQIEVVVHPQSIVHALIEFVDGSLKAHLGEPDMRVPIQYAITHPHRLPGVLEPFDLMDLSLTFERPDREAFPALEVAYEAGRRGGSAPAVLNAADEVAVQAFLGGRLSFLGIPRVLEGALEAVSWSDPRTVAEVLAVDREARGVAAGLIGGSC